MTSVIFSVSRGRITGFEISGHSGFAQAGADIICASVSSAAYMAANTITDVIKVNAKISADEDLAEIRMILPENLDEKNDEKCQTVLKGLKIHLEQLSSQYNKYLKVSEV